MLVQQLLPMGESRVLGRMVNLAVAVCLGVGIVVLICSPARATTFTWTGGSEFSDPDNWSPAGGPPDSNQDDAIFNLGGFDQVFMDASFINRQLQIQAGFVQFLFSDVTYELQPPGGGFGLAALIGTSAGPTATLEMYEGNVVTSGILEVGSVANSSGALHLLGTDWTGGSQSWIGAAGAGELYIGNSPIGPPFDPGQLTNTHGTLGVQSGSTGSAVIAAGGTWTNTGNLIVGNAGTGTLTINNFGTVTNDDDGILAFQPSGTGTVNVDGGVWQNNASLYVGGSSSGSGGTGTVNIDSGQVSVASDLAIYLFGDVFVNHGGTLTVNGEVTFPSPLQITGKLLLAGGRLEVFPAKFHPTGSAFEWTSGTFNALGPLTVDGGQVFGSNLVIDTDKVLDVDAFLSVGTLNSGSLTISGGGDVTSLTGTIGDDNGDGSVIVDGVGSTWAIEGVLSVRSPSTSELTVSDGGNLTSGNSSIAATVNTTANITITGANSSWETTGYIHLGGDSQFSRGAGLMEIADGASVTVGDGDDILRIWDDFKLTLTNGTLTADAIDVHGTLSGDGSSMVTLPGSTMNVIGGVVNFKPEAALDVTGDDVNVSAGGSLITPGQLTGDALTHVTLQDSDSTWTTTGPLTIGTVSTGPGEIGALTLQTGATVNINGQGVTVLDGSKLTMAGGTLNAATVDLGDQDLAGFGTINGSFSTNGAVTATGDLSVGDLNTINAVIIGGAINVGAESLTLRTKGFFVLSNATIISGGTLTVPNGVNLPGGADLQGSGVVDGRVALSVASTLEATGTLDLGDASHTAGFFGQGELIIETHTVTLHDANDAVLDSGALVTLNSGVLAAANGLTLDFGGNLMGVGTVDTPDEPATPLINNGNITGNSLIDPVEPITLTGYVKGVGTCDNCIITGTDAPGFSTAAVNRGSVSYKGTLEIEIGGTTPGSGYDQLNHILGDGIADLGGTIEVMLTGGFMPELGDSFEIITAIGGIQEMFTSELLPTLDAGLEFNISYNPSSVLLSVNAVRLPGDYNENGTVDAADYVVWRTHNGTAFDLPNRDPGQMGNVGQGDYQVWVDNFGNMAGIGSSNQQSSIPEPGSLTLLTILVTMIGGYGRHDS